jgi:hypothetical protein
VAAVSAALPRSLRSRDRVYTEGERIARAIERRSPSEQIHSTERQEKEKDKGSRSDVLYTGGKVEQRVKQFAIERGIDVPPPVRSAAKKSPKKAAAKPVPRGPRKTTR